MEEYKQAIKKLLGVNVIIENEKKEILTIKAEYGNKYRMLPGGGVERGELLTHAAISEVEEEVSLIIQEEHLQLLGIFLQRVPPIVETNGVLFLYKATIYQGEPMITDLKEVSEIKFLSPTEILHGPLASEFGLGYKRLVAHYLRIQNYGWPMIHGRLADSVEACIGGENFLI